MSDQTEQGQQEGFREPLDVHEAVEAVNGALGDQDELLEPAEGPEKAPAPPMDLLGAARAVTAAATPRVAPIATVVDGVQRMVDHVRSACERQARAGEPLTFYCFPGMVPVGPNGEAAQSFFVTLSIPGPLLGQPMHLGVMVQDITATGEQIDELVRKALEQLRQARHEEQQRLMSAAESVSFGPL